MAVGAGVAVLPGDTTGRWIPEFALEDYEKEIDDAEAQVASAPDEATFDPGTTASLLAPAGASVRSELQQTLERTLAARGQSSHG